MTERCGYCKVPQEKSHIANQRGTDMKNNYLKWTKIFQLLSSKIVLIFFVIIIPVNALLIYVSSTSIDILKQQASIYNKGILEIYMRQIERDMNSSVRYISMISSFNTNFIMFSSGIEGANHTLARYHLWLELMNRLYTQDVNEGIFIVNLDLNDLVLAYSATIKARRIMTDYLDSRILLNSERLRWHLVELGSDTILIRFNQNNNMFYGSFLIITDLIAEIYDQFYYENKELIVSTTNSLLNVGRGQLYYQVRSSHSSLYLSLILYEQDVLQMLPFINRFIYILSFVLVGLIPVVYLILYIILIKPLKRINRALNIVEDGNIEYRLNSKKSSVEFETINNAFNSMMEQISTLKIENYEKELQRKKMELKSLQLQTRPHFLLNLYNLIYSLAELKEYKKIQQMIQFLKKHFQVGIYNKSSLVSLESEVNFLQNYIEIAQIRYPDCFSINYKIDKNTLQTKVPTFLLQSFVENIFIHAIEIENNIIILIEIYIENDTLFISIQDNGRGIEESLLDMINSSVEPYIDKNGVEHTGIFNYRKQLELFYGNDISLIVTSKYDEGTNVLITIPNISKGIRGEI